MDVLVPIDGSDCSTRALRFACEMANRFDATLHVVHITDVETDATDRILTRAKETCAAANLDVEPRIETDEELEFQPAERIGRDVVDLVREHGYDHVVMGHHGSNTVGRFIVGSAAETVVEANEVPVTIVP